MTTDTVTDVMAPAATSKETGVLARAPKEWNQDKRWNPFNSYKLLAHVEEDDLFTDVHRRGLELVEIDTRGQIRGAQIYLLIPGTKLVPGNALSPQIQYGQHSAFSARDIGLYNGCFSCLDRIGISIR